MWLSAILAPLSALAPMWVSTILAALSTLAPPARPASTRLHLAVLALTIAVLLAPAMAGCHSTANAAINDAPVRISGNVIEFPARQSPTSIVAAEPDLEQYRLLTLTGRLVWNEDRTVRVQAPFSGRVMRIEVQLGDHVVPGSELAELSSPDYGAAQADYRKSEAAGSVAQRGVERARDLYARGLLSRSDLDQAEATAAATEADIARSRRTLHTYGDGGGRIDNLLALRSPISGVVVERNINPGQELRSDQTGAPQFVVTDPSSLWVQLDAHEDDLSYLRGGAELLVQAPAFPETRFRGHIIRVSDFVDPTTRTVKILGLVPNPERRLKGEMYVTAGIRVATRPELNADASSVLLVGGRHYVFVRRGDRFERHEVTIGNEQSGRVTLLTGVERGDSLVTDGALYLESLLEHGPGRA